MKNKYQLSLKYMLKKNVFQKKNYSYEGQHTIKYKKHIPYSIGAKLVCLDDRFTLPSIIFKGKYCINEFIKWVFRQKEWINHVIYQYFDK